MSVFVFQSSSEQYNTPATKFVM